MENNSIKKILISTGLSEKDKITHYFDHVRDSKDIGVLITDHNVRETLTITDRSYLLYNGTILKAGTTKTPPESETDFGELKDLIKGNTTIMLSESGNSPAKVIKKFRKDGEKIYLIKSNEN